MSRGFTTRSFKMLVVSDKDVSYLKATLLETHLLKQTSSSGQSPEPQNAICSQRGRRQNRQQRVTRQDARKGLSFTVTAPHPALPPTPSPTHPPAPPLQRLRNYPAGQEHFGPVSSLDLFFFFKGQG